MRRVVLLCVGVLCLVAVRRCYVQADGLVGYGGQCSDRNSTHCRPGLVCSNVTSDVGLGLRCLCEGDTGSCVKHFVDVDISPQLDAVEIQVTVHSDIVDLLSATLDPGDPNPVSPVKDTLRFEGLTPDTVYNISLSLVSKLDPSKTSLLRLHVDYTLPPYIRNVNHTEDGNGMLEVTWHQEGTVAHAQCVLIQRKSGPSLTTTTTSASCQWTNLPALTLYDTVNITIFYGQGNNQTTSHSIDPPYVYIPAVVASARFTSVRSTSLIVGVREKTNVSGHVGYYVIRGNDGSCVRFRQGTSCPQIPELGSCRPGTLVRFASTRYRPLTTDVIPVMTVPRPSVTPSAKIPMTSSTPQSPAIVTSSPTTDETSPPQNVRMTTTAEVDSSGPSATFFNRVTKGHSPSYGTVTPAGQPAPYRMHGELALWVEELTAWTTFNLTLTPWFCKDNDVKGAGESVALPSATTLFEVQVTKVAAIGKMISVQWEFPVAGQTVHFSVHATDVGPPRPGGCDVPGHTGNNLSCFNTSTDKDTERSCEIDLPHGSWNYSVTVTARAETPGTQVVSSKPAYVTTEPSDPGRVRNLRVETVSGPGEKSCNGVSMTRRTEICIRWDDLCPREKNGGIQYFEYQVRQNEKTYIDQISEEQATYEVLRQLRPNLNVDMTVFAVGKPDRKGALTTVVKSMPTVKSPPVPSSADVSRQVPDKFMEVSQTRITFRIESPVDFLDRWSVFMPAVLVTSQGQRPHKYDTEEEYRQNYVGWREGKTQGNRGYMIAVQTLTKRPNGRLTLTVGDDEDCSATSGDKFCNGPLDVGTKYTVWLVSCNEAFCEPFPVIQEKMTATVEENSSTGLGVGLFFLFFLIGLAVGFLFYMKNRRQKKFSMKDVEDGKPNKPMQMCPVQTVVTPAPMALASLDSAIAVKQRDDGLNLREEFEWLRSAESYPSDVGHEEINFTKNRYADIVAYDHSRVKLTPGEDGSDYINASYIPGYSRDDEYIACQGPVPHTINDFWRMVWEQRSHIIVMLTRPTENGKVKCEQYWPDEVGGKEERGDIVINSVSVSYHENCTITILALKRKKEGEEEEKREVVHFHYLNWPDKTADVCPSSLLTFIDLVRQQVKPHALVPTVVHCSAGVGRTGCFICLDYIAQFIKERPMSHELDIYGFVKRMREYRCLMVQTEEQYILLHLCARSLMVERYKQEAHLCAGSLCSSQSSESVDDAREADLPEQTNPSQHAEKPITSQTLQGSSASLGKEDVSVSKPQNGVAQIEQGDASTDKDGEVSGEKQERPQGDLGSTTAGDRKDVEDLEVETPKEDKVPLVTPE